MDLYYKLEIKVGLLVIAALVVLFGGIMWLSGRSIGGTGKVMFPVQFGSVSGLTEGDPVQVSGVQVGRVARVNLVEVGRVQVVLEVDGRRRPRIDATAVIKALDFLGAKVVSYNPGKAEQFLPDDGFLVGTEDTDLAEAAASMADRGVALLGRTERLLSDEMLNQVRATLAAAERALDVVGRAGRGSLVSQAESGLASLSSAASRLDSILATPDLRRSVEQLDELTTNVNEMAAGLAVATTALGQIMAKMDSAQGTFGKLVNDTTIHQDLHEVMRALTLLLTDLRERPARYTPGAIKIF